MRLLGMLIAFRLLCLAAPVQAAAATGPDEPAPAWVKLATLPGEAPNVSGIGVDPRGTFWVMLADRSNRQRLYWLDGEQWQQTELPAHFEEGSDATETTADSDETAETGEAERVEVAFLPGLHGGNGGALYATAAEGERGMLYELSAGSLKPVAPFAYAPPKGGSTRRGVLRHRPTLFVSRAGRVFHCGDSFVNVLVDGRWRPVTAPETSKRVSFLDAGDTTYLLCDTMLYTVTADGRASGHSLDGLERRVAATVDAYLWGEGRLLVIENGLGFVSSVLYAYRLETREALDVHELRAAFGTHFVFDAFSGPDGSVWLYTSDPRVVPMAYTFRFLTPEGDLFEIEETKQLDWSYDRSRFFPQSVLVASDGSVWLAQRTNGVVSYRAGVFKRYGEAAGFPFGFRFLAEAPDGTIYAASSNEVYALGIQAMERDEDAQ